VHQSPVFRSLVRVFSETGRRLRSARSLGVRFFAGLTASAVLFLLVVAFLWDLSGPERAVLNRSLKPIYERLSHLMGIAWAAGFWSLWGSRWVWGLLVALGVLRWVAWDCGMYVPERSSEFPGFPGIGANPVSGAFRSFVRIGFLAAGAYVSEVVFGGYIHRIHGASLSFSPGSCISCTLFPGVRCLPLVKRGFEASTDPSTGAHVRLGGRQFGPTGRVLHAGRRSSHRVAPGEPAHVGHIIHSALKREEGLRHCKAARAFSASESVTLSPSITFCP
jgi:hypothetical protein